MPVLYAGSTLDDISLVEILGKLGKFVTRNIEILDLLAPQFEEQLRQYKEENSFVELVRRAIQDRLTGQRSSIDKIAQALHMSPLHAATPVAGVRLQLPTHPGYSRR